MIALFDLADDVCLGIGAAVSIRNIAVDQVFQCNTIAQCTNGQRRIVNICESVFILIQQIQSHLLCCKVKNCLRSKRLAQLRRNGIVGFCQCLINEDILSGVNHGAAVFAVVGRPIFPVDLDWRIFINGAPLNEVAFQRQTICGQRLNGRTRLTGFINGIVPAERFCLFADCSDDAANTSVIVQCNEGRLWVNSIRNTILIGVLVGGDSQTAGVYQVIQVFVTLFYIGLHIQIDGYINLIAAPIDSADRLVIGKVVQVLQIGGEFVDGSIHHPAGCSCWIRCFFCFGIWMQCLIGIGIRENQRFIQCLLIFVIRDGAVVVHLPEYILLSFPVICFSGIYHLPGGFILVAGKWVVFVRAFWNGSQAGSFRDIQFRDIFPKIFLGSKLNAVGSTAESDIIEVSFQNFILGIGTLQFHCTENLSNFTGRRLFIITGQVFDELLGNGGTTLVSIVNMNEHIGKC